ncbi:hypothetical protein G3545_08415 [Starkeya sp. ORNL1]|uniref:hypothetical protein n=1 Tax=Starkeya sp. ORNL1 TaxID=2709380 RepID=UPI0014636F87|nr:hypothetical protein [Starkeya sp. ORNL1]QJP13676.1 hypothetical protein G3545_08415 [Starkeya sp. ORNL1]
MLPGFAGSQMMAAAGVVGLSFIEGANSFAAPGGTIAVPASALAGDLCVFIQRSQLSSTTAPAATIPSGFTLAGTTSASSSPAQRATISHKVLVSGDLGTTLSGVTSGQTASTTVLLFRPAWPIAGVTAVSVNGQGAGSLPATQTISISGQTPPIVAIAHAGSSSSGTLLGGSITATGTRQVGSSDRQDVWFQMFNTAPVNLTASMNDGGTNVLQSLGLVVAF